MSENDPVLVAVDGSERSAAALRYAAAEAVRVGAGLQILHVAPEFPPVVALCPTPLVASAEVEAEGLRIVAQARRAAEELIGPDRVTARLATGDRVAAILEMATEARIVVLGVGCASLLEHLIVGSTLTHVARRSAVPVVAVPSDWAPHSPTRPLVVALKHYDPAPLALIEAALERAAAEQVPLRLVHVWDVPQAYAQVVGIVSDVEEWARAVDERIRSDARDALARHPEVEVEILARFGQPATVLHELSAHASLLVIARPVHALPLGQHLGSTGRALLRASRCPVEVLPIPTASAGAIPEGRGSTGASTPSPTTRVGHLFTEGTAAS